MRVNKLIIWYNSFNDARVDIVDAWSKSYKTLGVIKDGVERSEEWLSKNPLVNIVVLEWEEALVSLSNVHDKALWC